MRANIIGKAIIEGLIQTVGLIIIIACITASFTASAILESLLVICIFLALVTAVVYLTYLFKINKTKEIICFSFISSLSFFLSLVVLLLIHFYFPFPVYSLRELNNADGLTLILYSGIFYVCSLVLKSCIFIILIIKNTYKKKIEDR